MNASSSMAISKTARTFQDLPVWQKAHRFVLEVYVLTRAFPKQRNIRPLTTDASCRGIQSRHHRPRGRRRGKADKARFMNIAEGSVEECRYFLIPPRTSATAMSKSSPPCWKKSADSSAHTPQPFWLLTPDFLDSHIPQGYQGRSQALGQLVLYVWLIDTVCGNIAPLFPWKEGGAHAIQMVHRSCRFVRMSSARRGATARGNSSTAWIDSNSASSDAAPTGAYSRASKGDSAAPRAGTAKLGECH